jgi:hypothetical protein
MTISCPLSLPSSPGFREITVRPQSAVADSRSPFTFDGQIQEHQGQMWAADVSLPVLSNADSGDWEAFLYKLNGRQGTFLLGDPVRATSRGSASTTPGTPTADGAHTIRTNALSIATGLGTTTGYLKAGDHIQIGSGSDAHLYAVLDDVDLDASGDATFDIWPKLRAALSGGETIVVDSAKGLFRLSQNELPFTRQPGPFTQLSFSCVEAL